MTLEDFYFVSQIIAALGIIASLIFVGLQVRSDAEQTRLNTRALKAASAFEAAHSWGTFNEALLAWPDEHFGLVIATHDPDKSWDDFLPEARARMTAFYLGTPGGREYWEDSKVCFGDTVVAAIDKVLRENPITIEEAVKMMPHIGTRVLASVPKAEASE